VSVARGTGNLTQLQGCRNPQAAEQLLQKCRDGGVATGDITVYKLDISSIESVKGFAKAVADKHPKLHYLINNGEGERR
jgi:NAD(P)-dependent dehydrogenase (short-subunit alcohol dehydrogenase family)